MAMHASQCVYLTNLHTQSRPYCHRRIDEHTVLRTAHQEGTAECEEGRRHQFYRMIQIWQCADV